MEYPREEENPNTKNLNIIEVELNNIPPNKDDHSPSVSDDNAEFLRSNRSPESKNPPTCLQRVKDVFGRIVPYGGFVSSVFNLASVCVGAGILGLPAAANSSGLLMAIMYLLVISCFAVFSLYILCKTMEKTGIRSFESMAKYLIGSRFDYFVAFIRWINSFGTTIAYIISVGDILQPILLNASGTPEYLKTKSGRRLLTSLTWLVLMLPLVLPKQVNSLRYVSTIAIIFVVYFVVMIVIHSSLNGLENLHHIDGETIKLVNTGNDAVGGLGVFMFAFVCQINCFEVYWEMTDRSIKRFTLSSAVAMILCCALYIFTVFFGYIEFGSKLKGSILLMYNPVAEPMVMVAYVGILVKLCVSYALQTMACRNAIYHVIRWEVATLPYWKHFIAVILLSTVVLLCGLFIPNINTVFGFVGAICGGFLSFVFPALFYLYSGGWTLRSVGWFDYVFTHLLLIAGVIGIVFGTIATIYSTVIG
ncbi:amino acid transporter [Trypanosoma theileri]|uniref:Amino acid transporter n=1 Tax=Trypanosoma theileri TaxID=67003 RepID=A0A1X0NRL7_9TRYP|nr:amino acid transporter [Trypanosoma theileri]ORC87356.1 amino acid transporter [Trypanosoma theileri]